jgi:prevent-host-death family protein
VLYQLSYVGVRTSSYCGEAVSRPGAGSTSATILVMATVPQKELRNNIGEVLRRAESGEQITITVSGRPVAELGPVRTRQWVSSTRLADLELLGGQLMDPWATT